MVYKSIVAALLVQASSAVQLNGAPVYVNPESMLQSNSMAGASLGLNIRMGPDDVAFSQKSKPSLVQLPEDSMTL
jgi:hypothetical protein